MRRPPVDLRDYHCLLVTLANVSVKTWYRMSKRNETGAAEAVIQPLALAIRSLASAATKETAENALS